MRTPRLSRLAAAALFVTTLSGTAASAAVGAGTPAGAASLPACNLKTLANHKGLVHITFWESASEANLTVLQGITNAFNSSQTKVHVTLVTQAGLRRHLEEVPGRPLQRAAARRRAARGPAHAGRHRHRLVPSRAVLHERGQVLDERLPAPSPRLLEGERRAVGPPLRRLGADPVLQPERLHEGRPQPGRPADHAGPDGGRRQGAQGLGQRHGPRPRPLAPRDVAGHGQPALRQQQERAQRPRHHRRPSTPRPPSPSSAS